MKLNELPADRATLEEPKRKGRGIGSGNGKTGGRGTKGQHARSGGFHKVGFEGGQMPLQRRLPKRGFTHIFKKNYALIHVEDLEQFDTGTEVTLEKLQEAGLVKKVLDGVKLLDKGTLSKALTVHVAKASRSAQAVIEALGGRVITPDAEQEGQGQ